MLLNRNQQSINRYFLKVFVVLIVIPILIMNVVINHNYEQILMTNNSERVIRVMEQMSLNYKEELTSMSFVISQIVNDVELMQLYNQWEIETNSHNLLQLSREINEKLGYIFHYDTDVETLTVFYEDGDYYAYGAPPEMTYEDVVDEEWYTQMKSVNGAVHKIGITQGITSNSGIKDMIAVAVEMKNPAVRSNVDFIYFEMKTPNFFLLHEEDTLSEIGNIMLIDGNGIIQIASDKTYIAQNVELYPDIRTIFEAYESRRSLKTENNSMYVSALPLLYVDGMLLTIVEEEMLTKDISGLLLIINSLFVVIVAFFIFFIVLFFRGLINPIQELIRSMKIVQKGDFESRFNVEGPKEIQELGNTYNLMVNEIKDLIHQRDEVEKERSLEEMRALQAQINPHFVHNTLNSIRLMAMMSKAEGIKNMLDAFMKILTKTFRDVGKNVRIEDEIDYLMSYVYIMTVRYGNDFSFEVKVDNEIKQLYIMNMLLQPMIENAIIHGYDSDKGSNLVKLEAYMTDDYLVVEVYDNGKGIDERDIPKLLSQSNAKSTGFNRLGVANVNRRIKLNYGDIYGIDIDSKKGAYTKIILTLPILKE